MLRKTSIISTKLVLLSIVLNLVFTKYDVRDGTNWTKAPDLIGDSGNKLISFGQFWREAKPTDEVYSFGGKIFAYRGLYARPGYSIQVAEIAGVIAPLILLGIAAVVFFYGRRHR